MKSLTNVSQNWARSTRIERPWATSETPKSSKPSGRLSSGKNLAMSGEWADEHTSTIHVFEMEAQSALAQLLDLRMELKAQAVEFERKIKRAAMSPFQILRSVVQLVQK